MPGGAFRVPLVLEMYAVWVDGGCSRRDTGFFGGGKNGISPVGGTGAVPAGQRKTRTASQSVGNQVPRGIASAAAPRALAG